MEVKDKIPKNKVISTKIVTYFTIAFLLIAILFYFLMPELLNYPPDTINTKFDKDVSLIYYIYQYSIVITFVLISRLTLIILFN